MDDVGVMAPVPSHPIAAPIPPWAPGLMPLPLPPAPSRAWSSVMGAPAGPRARAFVSACGNQRE